MRLDLRRLTYFKAIADAGSLSEAARRLSVPQPALSYHVKELETEFGAPLLNRAQNGATVTEAGQLLLDHATIITAQVARASEEMRRFRERGTARHGAIRLSALPSLATPLVPLLLSRASAELSNAGVYVIESSTREARDMLSSGEIDFAIVVVNTYVPPEQRIADERLLFVMAARHSDAVSEPITLSEALAEPVLLPGKGKPVRELVEQMARQVGASVRVMHEIDGPNPRKQAVISGLARSFLPWVAIRDEVANGEIRFRDVVDPPLQRWICLESGKNADPAIGKALERMLRDILCPMLIHPPERRRPRLARKHAPPAK